MPAVSRMVDLRLARFTLERRALGTVPVDSQWGMSRHESKPKIRKLRRQTDSGHTWGVTGEKNDLQRAKTQW